MTAVIDEVQLERRLTRLEDTAARVEQNTEAIAEQMKIANGRTGKVEAAIAAHEDKHALREQYDRGLSDGRSILKGWDMAKLGGLFTFIAALAVALSKAL